PGRRLRPAEADLAKRGFAEILHALGDVETAVTPEEPRRVVAVLEAPDHQAAAAQRLQKPAAFSEQPTAKPYALEFRTQIDLVDFAVIRQRLGAIQADRRIAGNTAGDVEHEQCGRPARRLAPPGFAAPLQHLRQRPVRNEPRIGLAPGGTMRFRDRARIPRLRWPDIDRQRFHNATLDPFIGLCDNTVIHPDTFPQQRFWRPFGYVNAFLTDATSLCEIKTQKKTRRKGRAHRVLAESRSAGHFRLVEALAVIRVEIHLAQTNRLRRDFHQLVILDPGERPVERHADRRSQLDGLVLASSPDIG